MRSASIHFKERMMIVLQGITYIHPNRDVLFDDLNLIINKSDKIALIGNNGAGKSTLLQLLSGQLQTTAGSVTTGSQPYYVPQIFGQFNQHTVAQALNIDHKLNALHAILEGEVTEENMDTLNDDWTIEERCQEAFAHWKLDIQDLNQPLQTLSGGQKTKVFLAGISIHQPEIVLLDEPSNHLDNESREILYNYISSTKNTVLIVSHDRILLNLLDNIFELSKRGITIYGGNYDFYTEQKQIEAEALNQALKSQEKAIRKAKETERQSLERQQKLDARGKRKQEKSGVPTIFMNTLRNNAENSSSKIKGVHAEKVSSISKELGSLRKEQPDIDQMKMGFDNAALPLGKVLITANSINFAYGDKVLWKAALNFQISSGERIAIEGPNGSGKSTLIKLILSGLQPQSGNMKTISLNSVYIDQDYSLIHNELSVYEQAQHFNSGVLQEHDVKTRLNRFLFDKTYWDKPCRALSGGEKMRLMLCCLTITNLAPDMIILDEPTNNLDIQNIEILTAALNEYRGTLLLVSHDSLFLREINVERSIILS